MLFEPGYDYCLKLRMLLESKQVKKSQNILSPFRQWLRIVQVEMNKKLNPVLRKAAKIKHTIHQSNAIVISDGIANFIPDTTSLLVEHNQQQTLSHSAHNLCAGQDD